jgi:hypothetical protein
MEEEKSPLTLAEALEAVPEFRRQHLREHELVAVLQIAVAAMLCGARSQYAVAQWAKERLEDAPHLLIALGCKPGKRPSHPTIHRVFKSLNAAAFERVLGGWLSQVGIEPDEALAVDGKSLRGIHGEALPGVHLVSVYALQSGVVLSQMTAGGKGTELSAVKEALKPVDLVGKTVMGDALQTQRDVCEQIVEGGGHYLFPVKENPPTLHSDLVDAFSPAPQTAGGERREGSIVAGAGVEGKRGRLHPEPGDEEWARAI